MKTNLKILWMAALFALVSEGGLAGPVGPLTTFTAGTSAKAAEVNGNFSAVSTAVNDNASRITTLETTVIGGTVTPAGNIVVVPSTATAGNIMKGTAPFVHNFGTDNTFIGVNAGNFTMTGAGGNTASGTRALQSNTAGNDNTASGASALQNNTTGTQNTASGFQALFSNTTGQDNTASGAGALLSNITGGNNTASGTNALQNNTNSNNTASGAGALQLNTTGNNNTASGVVALGSNASGNFNTAIGSGALFSNTTGSANIAVGINAGANLTTGSNNIHIGNAGDVAESNTIRIGTTVTQTRTFIAGIRGVTTAGANAVNVVVDSAGQLGTVSSSRGVKDHIADMGGASGVLMKLRPVTFHYKTDRNPAGRTLQYGLVAEEVAEVAPGLVAHSADGRIETVYYQFLAPMLLNEYQRQQRTIEAQAARVAELEKQGMEIAELKQQVVRMAGLLVRLEQAGMIATAGR